MAANAVIFSVNQTRNDSLQILDFYGHEVQANVDPFPASTRIIAAPSGGRLDGAIYAVHAAGTAQYFTPTQTAKVPAREMCTVTNAGPLNGGYTVKDQTGNTYYFTVAHPWNPDWREGSGNKKEEEEEAYEQEEGKKE